MAAPLTSRPVRMFELVNRAWYRLACSNEAHVRSESLTSNQDASALRHTAKVAVLLSMADFWNLENVKSVLERVAYSKRVSTKSASLKVPSVIDTDISSALKKEAFVHRALSNGMRLNWSKPSSWSSLKLVPAHCTCDSDEPRKCEDEPPRGEGVSAMSCA